MFIIVLSDLQFSLTTYRQTERHHFDLWQTLHYIVSLLWVTNLKGTCRAASMQLKGQHLSGLLVKVKLFKQTDRHVQSYRCYRIKNTNYVELCTGLLYSNNPENYSSPLLILSTRQSSCINDWLLILTMPECYSR